MRLACLALALAAGCGSFDNQRFAVGDGSVVGRTVAGADVWVVGRPDLATTADPHGSFLVAGVPVGGQRLVVSVPEGAALTSVQVVGGAVAEAGLLAPAPPATLSGRAPAGSLVWVPGTALVDRAGPDGAYVLSGLPRGCLPVALEGGRAVEVCISEDTEARLEPAEARKPSCGGQLDCPAGMPCTGGRCEAPECFASHGCDPGWACDAGTCVPDCECGPDQPCAPGLACRDACWCERPPCDPEAAEVCNGLDDDCDGEIDEGLGVGEPCGPPALCGTGELACGPGGAVVCTTAPKDGGCRGFGPTVAVHRLVFSPYDGFDLDDADGDGDPTTGIDNALVAASGLVDLIVYDMERALLLEDGREAGYLVELAGLRPDGSPVPGAELRLRVYLGAEDPEQPGRYEILSSAAGVQGEPLGELPVASRDASGVIAGPGPLTLWTDTCGTRRPFPLRPAYVGVEGLDAAVPGQVVRGELGGAVRVDTLLSFVHSPFTRNLLDRMLSPGDIDADGDGTPESVSLGLQFFGGRVGLTAR